MSEYEDEYDFALGGCPACSVCGEAAFPKRGGIDLASGAWDCGADACRSGSERRAPLLEVVDGVPIVKKLRAAARPAPLTRGRLFPGGPLIEVDRITAGAMYIHKVYDPPLIREIGREELDAAVDTLHKSLPSATPSEVFRHARAAFRAAGEYRQVKVSRGPAEPGISPASIIYPE